ncbi:MAG: hypothetical protein HC883_01450 [Bdellovibrionaceae bacterium]|nr:hypothetical protein [Pseudobdellovibrionaceae bacterium]
MVTREDIKDSLIIRLGQRSDLSSSIEREIKFAQVWLENRPFLPFFLQKNNYTVNTSSCLRVYPLPTDFLREVDIAGIKGSFLVGEPNQEECASQAFEEVRKYDPGVLDVRYINATPGKPTGYAIQGAEFLLGPTPDRTYTVLLRSYFARAAELTGSASTNVWTLNSPDSLIAATGLRMSMGFLKSEKVYAEFRAYFDEVERSLIAADVGRQEAGVVRTFGEM